MTWDYDSGDLYRDLAGRFSALSQVFAELGTEEGTRRLLDSLVSDDPAAFNQLIEHFEVPGIPQLGKCFWLRELIDVASVTSTRVEVCVLREDLTPDQRLLYLSIARRHNAVIPLTDAERAISLLGDGEGIPPGAFLDELKANDLVMCTTKVKFNVTTQLAFGKPERVCV